MLDDRKLSARALFDSSSNRQTQLAVQVHTGQTVCYKLPFHVYVSTGAHTNSRLDFETTQHLILSCWGHDVCCFCCCRTRQITSVLLASHCGLRSMIQRAVQCWMKAGQLLSRNLWVDQHKFIKPSFCTPSHFLPLFSPLTCPCVPLQIQFFKDCGEDDVCTTDLVLQAHMDISGTKYRYEIFFRAFTSPRWLQHDEVSAHLWGFSDSSLWFPRRQKPYVIRSPRRRLAVEVQLQNRLENAYNTSLTLHYSRNLHFSSLSIRVKHTNTYCCCIQHNR